MKKRLALLMVALFLVAIVAGCGAKDSVSKKVELRDDPVKSSTDYQGGTGNVANGSTSNQKDDSSSGGLKVGFIQTANESGWRAAHTQSMQDTFGGGNYTYKFVDGQGDQKVQVSAMEQLIEDKYDVIILAPIVEEGWDDILKKAKDANIPVIIVDRMVSSDKELYTCWVGSDFNTEGVNAAKWLAENSGTEEQNIVVLEGTIGSSAQLGRKAGFESEISKHGNYHIIASETADFDKAKGQKLMDDYLAKYPKIDVIVTHNDNMAYGVIESLKAAGKDPKDYTIVSFDGEANAFREMIEGNISVDVECNPLQGPTVEAIIKDVLSGKKVEKTQYMEEGIFPASVAKDEVANRKY